MIRQARAKAKKLETTWRLYYKYGPKDPRFLEMTEPEIFEDLMVLKFHNDPDGAKAAEGKSATQQMLETAPQKMREMLDRVEKLTASIPVEGLFPKAPQTTVIASWCESSDEWDE